MAGIVVENLQKQIGCEIFRRNECGRKMILMLFSIQTSRIYNFVVCGGDLIILLWGFLTSNNQICLRPEINLNYYRKIAIVFAQNQ